MKKLLLLAMIALLCSALAACGSAREEEVIPDEPVAEEVHYYNPLTNMEVSEPLSNRVFAVSIDNHPDARPHFGISKADIVYEVPAEGQIPRLIGIFYGNQPDQIGPVRSARPYIVDIAREWGAVMVHCGGSTDALNYLSTGVVTDLNEIAYHDYFWRYDGNVAPHNLLTSSENIYRFLKDYSHTAVNENVRQLTFLPRNELAAGEKADWIQVEFMWADNVYIYDRSLGCYSRITDGDAFIDAANNETVRVSNIIVQKVNSWLADGAGHLGMDLCAGGEAWLFTGGRVKHGSWSRDGLDSPTLFVDDNGNAFRLNSGQTWIELVDGNTDFTYKNTAAETAAEEAVQ